MEEKQKTLKQKIFRWVKIIGITILGTCLFVGLSVLGESTKAPLTPAQYFQDNSHRVIGDCEKVIKEKLKTPSTAKFSKMELRWGKEGSNTDWGQVLGIVESQNSFGVPLQSAIMCTARYNHNNTHNITGSEIFQ